MPRYIVLEVKYKTDSEKITVKLYDKDKGKEVYVDVFPSDLINIKNDKQ